MHTCSRAGVHTALRGITPSLHPVRRYPAVSFRQAPTVIRSPRRPLGLPVREAILDRVRGEFAISPTLRLTPPQFRRLFGLRDELSARVLDTLLRARYLSRTPDGQYCRTDMLE